jgi:2-polyprenyl-3-methyl-5-hydroxy-6-metoxy-1,4-benzoquinol methylase
MSPGFLVALRSVARAYRRTPTATRLHVLGRFLSCPFLRVLPHLPSNARLLDLGAGHGLFARLALLAGARAAVTVEPDFPKVCVTPAHPAITAVAGYADAVTGTFDAASVCDVLCRMPMEHWDGLLGAAFDRLRPGGTLLLKEIDSTHRAKATWNRLQERGADLLGLTLGTAFSYEPPTAMLERLDRLGFIECRAVPIGRGYPHAHLLYLAKRPGPT